MRLFRLDPAYIHSDILSDLEQPGHYLTLDHWKNHTAYRAFRERIRDEYQKIDALCEQYTLSERQIGDYDPSG